MYLVFLNVGKPQNSGNSLFSAIIKVRKLLYMIQWAFLALGKDSIGDEAPNLQGSLSNTRYHSLVNPYASAINFSTVKVSFSLYRSRS